MPILRKLPTLCFAILSIGAAYSSVFGTYATVGAVQGSSPTAPALGNCYDTQTTPDVAAVVAPGCVAYNSGGTLLTISGSAYADAVKLGVSDTFNLQNGSGPFSSSGYARIIDHLNISNFDPNGTISFRIHLDGSTNSANMSFSAAALTFGFNYSGSAPVVPFGVKLPASGPFDGDIYTPAYPVAYFQNNDYFISFAAQNLFNSAVPANAFGSVLYANTASITGIAAYDSSGRFAPNAVATSTGGANFQIIQSPEPAAGALVALSLVLFLPSEVCDLKPTSVDSGYCVESRSWRVFLNC